MKLVTFSDDKGPRVGILTKDGILDVPGMLGSGTTGHSRAAPAWAYDMVSLIENGPKAMEALRALAQRWRATASHPPEGLLDPAHTKLLAPIPRPRKNIFCVGLNYVEHAMEGAGTVGRSPDPPQYPAFFTKPPTSVVGPGDFILWDTDVTQELDYEVEMGAIIGRKGLNIRADEALDFVFGYTIINDVSARDLQRRHGQWFKGKSLDTTSPLGPCIVTKDSIPDPQELEISLCLNGITMQASNTRHMVFTVANLVSQLSQGTTLEPGDILATGTPGGVGFVRQPPVFLKEGDVVDAEIERIGVLTNGVRLAGQRAQ
jgi:2-keto-4-pentenoate hydratase/2-oxohepta-3-ene-1,7-dioic acid hydratase in catechol pathway